MTKSIIKWSIMVVGATAMASQIIFLREFFVIYKGNELSIGIILANWLIWGAFGSAICGKLADKICYKSNVFSICQFLLGLFIFTAFLIIRISGNYPGNIIGEIIGYPQIFINTFLILSIPCAIMGFLFSLGCSLYKKIEPDKSRAVTSVYIYEALGSLFGGLFAGYLLVKYLPVFMIISGLLIINLVNAVILQFFDPETFKSKIFTKWLLTFITIVLMVFLFAGGARSLDKISIDKLWKGFTVIANDNSIYGNVTLTKRGEQVSFYENGIYMYTVPDKLSSEEAVHYNLLQNKAPKKILLIGGGVGGCLEEILKYEIQKVDYVELDPLIIEFAEQYLNENDKRLLADNRVNIINQDGRYFIKRSDTKYDSIIINVGDPYNAQVNRFYTVECFREIAEILKDDGVLSFSLTSNENYISDEAGEYLASIYNTAKRVFPDILMIPGDTAIFLMSKRKGNLSSDQNKLIARKEERAIKNIFVEDYFMFDKLSAERITEANEVIERYAETPINCDFKPISYYFSIKYWSTQLKTSYFSRLFSVIKPYMIWSGFGIFAIFVILVHFLQRRKQSLYPFITAVMTTGFSEIVFQLSVIIAFQVIYGFVYQKIAIIFISFMAGLSAGGCLYYKYSIQIKDKKSFFKKLQLIITLYPLLLPLVFIILSSSDSSFMVWLGSTLILPLLPFMSGLIGGVQFPVVNDICFSVNDSGNQNIGRISGLNYGMDLFGAAIGALIAAAILIPILGIVQTCILTALINLLILFLLKLKA